MKGSVVIRPGDIKENFAGAMSIPGGLIRCEVETDSIKYYYFRPALAANLADCLLISENLADDDFAREVLVSVEKDRRLDDGLTASTLPRNRYLFTHLLFAPPAYHRYLGGVLDAKREHLLLCLPIHRCEFSGNESVEQFFHMRRHTIDSLNMRRKISPKVVLRVHNPVTTGSIENGEVVSTDELLQEIDDLNGVSRGFIEFQNWQEKTAEILSPARDLYIFIRDRDDSTREEMTRDTVMSKALEFVTQW